MFNLNKHGHLMPCRTGSHLQSCKNFECNLHFKCPQFYCIPWAYVCDGKWDCPYGHDETLYHKCGDSRHFVNLFRCKGSQICIHVEDVCDGIKIAL